MKPLKVPAGALLFQQTQPLETGVGTPTMLERMWEPTLGEEKIPGLTRPRRQKVQLFEEQIKAKTPCFRAWKGSERLRELQKAFLRHLASGGPEAQKVQGLGLSFTDIRQRV